MTTPVFELRNINYYFDNKHVLENINIKINKGEFLAIVGPNGVKIHLIKSDTWTITFTKRRDFC